ncbi:16363_t:CDS:2, partial [Cetraspora pellucida]
LLVPLILRIEINHQEGKINDYQLNEISLEGFLNEKFIKEANEDFYTKLEIKHGKIRGIKSEIENKIQIEHLIAKKSEIVRKNSEE